MITGRYGFPKCAIAILVVLLNIKISEMLTGC